MVLSIDRRTTMRGGAALLAGLLNSKFTAAAAATQRLVEGQAPMSAMLPHTRYFEIDSVIAGARYAVWVTTPPTYDQDPERHYPIIYCPDGNGSAPSTIPRSILLQSDPINPITPFIQVCVGYAGDDVKRSLAVRARDLLPPSEPTPPGLEISIATDAKDGLLDKAGAELYLHNLRNPAGDKFLAFLTEELHPLIAPLYRISQGDAGLFGYSFGGLFATYAALRRTSLFRRVGAGSPGILPNVSSIFAMYAQDLKAKADYGGRMLHMTVNALELTAPSYYQPLVAAGTAQFMALAGQSPLPGLAFSSHIVEHESHATGYAPSWFSYLRTCYPARP